MDKYGYMHISWKTFQLVFVFLCCVFGVEITLALNRNFQNKFLLKCPFDNLLKYTLQKSK